MRKLYFQSNFMNLRKCALWAMCFFSVCLQAKELVIVRTTGELKEGLVVTETSPRLGWVMTSPENGTRQTAYEIEVKDALTEKEVWNTGKVISEQSQLIPTDLLQGHYRWQVRVWDEKDAVSAWSAPSEFIITDAGTSFDNSQWIGAITQKNARLPKGRIYTGAELKKTEVKEAWANVDSLAKKSILLRKEFVVEKKVKKAIAYVCGLGLYEFSLNGNKVGDSEFAPLISDYEKSVWYNTYDVTSCLKNGTNAIGIWLGNGFYNVQGGRYRKLLVSFGAPTLRLCMDICYEDGTQQTVVTDQSWKYDLSPVTFNCIYGGEDYDARLEQKEWNVAGFDDRAWRTIVVQDAPEGRLRPQLAKPVKIMERYVPKTVTKLTDEQVSKACKSTKRTVDSSAFVLDMGQNLSGFPEITVKGKKGQKITLLVAESLTDEGACNQRQTGRQHYYEYTLKGDGEETWHPRFSYYGFRYIQVEGAVMKGQKNPRRLPVIRNIESCFIYNSAPKVSTFESSNGIFNAAHRLIEKAVRSNMQGVFTDCPHREKLGWLEQVHLNGPGLLYNYDLTGFAPQILQNIADAQRPNGSMPTTAPEFVVFQGPGMDDFAESPEWGCTLVVFPFMYYEWTGDDSLIRKYYGNMRRYADYLATRANRHILSFGLGDWYDYGNFRAGFSRNTPIPLVATAHYYLIVDYLKRAARMVGNQYDEHHYALLAENINKAFHREFYDADKHLYGTGSQCSLALPLFLDMVPKADRKQVLDCLVADIQKHGNRLTTGDVGNRYLFQTLARNGLNELMYTMHNHEEAPGYGFQLKFGATTLTEQWDPRQGSSWNHFMMGQIDEWFFRSLAGFETSLDHPGMKQIEIAPQLVGDLAYVSASAQTLYGKVSVNWKRKGDTFTIKVHIPVGCSAKVVMPDGKTVCPTSSGSYEFQCKI